MSMVTDLLNKRAAEVERPPLLPAGTYRWGIKDTPVQGDTQSGWEFIRFPCQPIEALDDVDEDDLEAFGPLGPVVVGKAFFFSEEDEHAQSSERSAFELRSFLEAIGAMDEDMTISQGLASAKGLSFIAEASWRQDKKDENNYFIDIGKVIPDEED